MKLEWKMTILTIISLGYFEYEIKTVIIFRGLFVSRFAQEMKHQHKYDNLLIKYVHIKGQLISKGHSFFQFSKKINKKFCAQYARGKI